MLAKKLQKNLDLHWMQSHVFIFRILKKGRFDKISKRSKEKAKAFNVETFAMDKL
jgi:hypothetical protein